MLVSQAGEYLFLPHETFTHLIEGTLDVASDAGCNLRSAQIIAGEDLETAIALLATKLRTRKAHLNDFTGLHMVVLTRCCNCRCTYCQASSSAPEEPSPEQHMSLATARKVVEMILQSPSPVIKIEFQGGEPTLNWPVLREIVTYAERCNARYAHRRLEFVVCTNLVDVSDAMLTFCRDHQVMISSSLDGPPAMHDTHRLARNQTSSHAAFVQHLARARQIMGHRACSPLVTITRDRLPYLRDIIDEYRRLEFQGIFFRPVNPYGFARDAWEQLHCPVEDYVAAYLDALAYIIALNQQGEPFVEYYTMLLLTRILTPFSTGFMDLQSPAGAGINGVIYDYDGAVYPTDEGRMLARRGDTRFRLGSVHQQTYQEIFLGEHLRTLTAQSCVEALPGCADCPYQLYCGADPIRYYVESGDEVGHRPTSEFCRKHRAIFDHLFHLLQANDPEVMAVFWSWITHRRVEEVRV